MATITADTYLDSGTARTAGETWTMSNKANLKIRTDSRWHAGSPASMTGSLSTITCSASGGGMFIDGTTVRWVSYNSGSGNVPAIGTTITSGLTSGYLLGVWASLTAAPTAVGAAMPATGFLKFREVTDGPFAAGALTGIGATAVTDEAGWIEVVLDAGVSINMSYKGDGIVTTGDWFYLDNTNGSRGQTIQVPTNGGGAGTFISTCQIETGVGTGVYEWYTGVSTAVWLTSNFTTDARNKLFESVAGGIIRIGATSAAASLGYLPVSGCKVRIPNILLRQCATGSRASNATPSTDVTARTLFRYPAGGTINLYRSVMDWGLTSTTNDKDVSITILECGIDGALISTSGNNININQLAIGQCVAQTASPFQITKYISGTIEKLKVGGTAASNTSLSICSNLILTDILSIRYSATPSQTLINISYCNNIIGTNVVTINGAIQAAGSKDITINNHDYTAYSKGDTDSSNGIYCVNLTTGTSSFTYNGLTFGLNGTLSNCHPYQALFNLQNTLGNIKFRNIGNRSGFLGVGANSAIYPDKIMNLSAVNNLDIKLQNIYLANSRTGVITLSNANNCIIENVGCGASQTPTIVAKNTIAKGLYGTHGLPTPTSGMIFQDSFSSDIVGKFVFFPGSEPTSFSSPYFTSSIISAVDSGWDNAGTVKFTTNGDTITIETPYAVLGHTAFGNVAITGLTTADCSYDYYLDTGSGYGSAKTLNLTNLLTETLNPAGTKMKIVMTRTSASNTVSHTAIVLSTVSTNSAQVNNQYPLDTNSLSFTGLIAGSEVRCYTGIDPTTAVEIGGVESTSGSTFTFNHSSAGIAGRIAIFALGYMPIYLPYTYVAQDTSILIQPVVDRNYTNPA